MTFVTKLRFQSGDRAALDGVVTELKELLETKGAECKGPHSSEPETLHVPMAERCQPGERFEDWSYTVYRRAMEIHGADHIAGDIGHKEFPASVHVEIQVDHKQPAGSGD